MNSIRICLIASAITLLVACAVHSTEAAGRVNWRTNTQVKDFLSKRPMARRMTEGPLGGILDLIIDILLILIDIILGGALAPLKSQMAEMQDQMQQMSTVMGKN